MSTFGQTQTDFVRSGLAISSLGLGVVALLFPALSIAFLVARNGGPGYVQSLICGAPIAILSILTGVGVLAHNQARRRPTDWRPIAGVILGVLFFAIALVLVAILLAPYLLGGAG